MLKKAPTGQEACPTFTASCRLLVVGQASSPVNDGLFQHPANESDLLELAALRGAVECQHHIQRLRTFFNGRPGSPLLANRSAELLNFAGEADQYLVHVRFPRVERLGDVPVRVVQLVALPG